MTLDLKPHHRRLIRRILSAYVPDVAVYAFGSRARHTVKRHSDLDLIIRAEAPLDERRMAALCLAFEDSDLPFRVDVLDWHNTDKNFIKRIEQDFVAVQRAGRHRASRN